ncbi:hypothetical protein [Phenylobacterium sp.]|uniref:hypothetical protein n=1 Tax=Phenylobacterium sp. TaxID=1871053 RepID=UPI002DEDB801|nr:hypothetical protein [Phenylobacterium sp.]
MRTKTSLANHAAALLGAPLILLAVHPAAASVSLSDAFGGTIISTYPDGRTARLWLQASGDYTAEGRRGDRSSGHWRQQGERMCLRQSRPFPSPFSFCTPMPSGDSWTAKAVTGEPIRVQLVRGRDGGALASAGRQGSR